MLRISALLILLLLAAPTLAAPPSYYIGPRSGADLYDSPSPQSKKVAHLDRLTTVRITQKKRTWWHVETEGRNPVVRGWVSAGAIRQRYQPSASSRSTSLFSGLSSLFGGGRDANTEKTAVLGVRGLDEETTAKAGTTSGTNSAVRWMEGLRVSQQEVNTFIREGDLNP